ncbi:class I SAM-dependent DNA methyltransferase [Brachybacterium fresconis]|uniref:SAM-dependent methyltransferase n=1 Tax=Brachybacterium fresconis TaxID=173363 RepID=A0ABS4YJK5_9MICO|nr:SAM-dependent methyltransferase [Brachybacterium fresconis]
MTSEPATPPPRAAPDALYSDPRLAACYDTFDGERDDLDHYEAILAELDARSVIDVGCGTGTLAVRLAASGLDVTGVDPAAASLEVARSKPSAEIVRWIHGTVGDLPELVADAAVMTGNVAQVFTTDEAWSHTLQGIRAALRRGGHLVFESRRPERRAWEEWQAETAQQAWDVPGTGRVISRPTRFEVDLPLVTFADEFTFLDGATRTSTTTLRFREEHELRSSVEATGFTVVEIRQAPDRPGREFVVIARAV